MAETYPLVNYCNIDPENHHFLEETNLPTPICQGQTVNLPGRVVLFVTGATSQVSNVFFSPMAIHHGYGLATVGAVGW